MDRSWTRPFALLGAISAAVVVAGGSAAAPNSMLDPADPLALEVKGLHDDISLANLIRGLNLTGDQLDVLAEAAARADALRDDRSAQARPLLAEMEAAFGALRAELLTGGEPGGDVKRRAVTANRELQDHRRGFERELADLELQLRDALDDGQVTIIETFKPCLIPPQELGEPPRVGQSGAGGKAVEVLGELRLLPANTYERRLQRFVDRGIEIIQLRTGPLSPEIEDEYRTQLVQLVDEARSLDDLTWTLEGPQHAARLHEIVGDDPPSPPRSAEGTELTRVGRLLLAPGAAEVLAALASSS